MEKNCEFKIKLDRFRDFLENKGLWGVYMKRQDLTCGGVGYVAVGDMGNCGLLVTRDSLYTVTNNIEVPRMDDEERLTEMGFEILSGLWHEIEFESAAIRSISKDMPMGRDFGPDSANIARELQKLRFSLTDQEVQRYPEGGTMVSRLVEETMAFVRPGDTEWSVVARIAERARCEGVEVMPLFRGSDERISRYRHAIATGKRIRERVQMGETVRKLRQSNPSPP